MWKIPDSSVIFITVIGMMTVDSARTNADDTLGTDFEELKTETGDVFVNVFVKRAESNALVIRNGGGIAGVCLFNLNPSIQEKYNFDPVAAMKADIVLSAEESEHQKALVLEIRKREEAPEKAGTESDLIRLAQTDRAPVEAAIGRDREWRYDRTSKEDHSGSQPISINTWIFQRRAAETGSRTLHSRTAHPERSGSLREFRGIESGRNLERLFEPGPGQSPGRPANRSPHLPVHPGVARTP